MLAGEAQGFALLHHWRVLPGRPPVAPEQSDIDAVVAQFDGDPAVRTRLEELADASHSLVLFCEYVAHPLVDRLGDPLAGRGRRAAAIRDGRHPEAPPAAASDAARELARHDGLRRADAHHRRSRGGQCVRLPVRGSQHPTWSRGIIAAVPARHALAAARMSDLRPSEPGAVQPRGIRPAAT